MAATQNVPVSEIIRNKSSGDDEPKKKSREDWRKAKELEEARKAGTAPAAVDEEGKDINPHIPQYISQAPWYFGSKGPTLKHQRPQPEREKQFARVDEWYKRGVSTNAAIKYRKGACENCGAMTHKKKDCMERPRRVGAKFTGTNIAPDEFIQPELSMDYDGKRDRWAGYDPSEHKSIIEEYQKIEEAKRQLRAEKLNSNVDGNAETEDIDEDDEDKYVDEVDMPGTKVDSKQRITVRNLRIREDTAKYLRNLDPNSAYYDPKTRSMRDNPHAGTGVNEQDVDYAGENFVRFTGDTQKHSVAQLFAWEAYEKGVDVHLLAEPTKLEMLQHEYEKKKEQFKSQAQGSILEKYGGAEHLQAPPKALLLAQTEDYVEYSRYGKLIKGQEKQIIRSKYEEDIFPNNHTSVWGSYWQNGQWGYKCCHSFVKNSYCTGEAGKAAASDLQRGMKVETEPLAETKNSSSSDSDSSDSDDHSDKDSEETEKKKKQNKKKKKKEKKKKHLEKKRKGKKDSPEDKLKMALQQEDLNQQEAERILSMDERKRPYNSMFEVKKPTEEEIEAYYMKKRRDEDPMTQFMK
ncbi:pre-mRNA-splicing factor Slu7 [Schistocerca piceifrons]|uniref:pre-mRNA-splicing factor Slu7 n=1 Tax=Schistocerca piceifrons TaxID=274613 RepID=UPI001F5EA1D5|nr:pre-mRNA-splicing factor Slu7 [Schistocerca piceifrons]XP_047118978.1 pre-mRNA-splicing factor Slu7 [Schistocerca piceifrons]XP_047118979.1 pre-mRNA-splicing factor Slu7 [Schistocerca piceifrons]